MELYEEAQFVVLTSDAAAFSKVNVTLKRTKNVRNIFHHALLGVPVSTASTPRGKTKESKLKRAKSKLSGSASTQSQMFGTFVSLTRLAVNASLLEESAFLQVSGDIVAELRELTFASFSLCLLKRWKEVERDLEASKESCKSARGLDKLIRAVQRIYPALLVSDFGMEIIKKLHAASEAEEEQSIDHLIKATAATGGSKRFIRIDRSSKFE